MYTDYPALVLFPHFVQLSFKPVEFGGGYAVDFSFLFLWEDCLGFFTLYMNSKICIYLRANLSNETENSNSKALSCEAECLISFNEERFWELFELTEDSTQN